MPPVNNFATGPAEGQETGRYPLAVPMPNRVVRAVALTMILVVLASCGAETVSNRSFPTRSSAASPQPVTDDRIEAMLEADGSLGVTVTQFIGAWNARVQATGFQRLALQTLPPDSARGDGWLSFSFNDYIQVLARLNDDRTLRSVAVIDRTVTLDLTGQVTGGGELEPEELPPAAALARNYMAAGSNPRLTADELGHLAVDVMGTTDEVTIGTWGMSPVYSSLERKDVTYTFLTDVRGALWYIAQQAS